MTKIVRTHKIRINAPLQSVFEYVSDLTRHPEWSDGELRIEPVTPRPITVGTEYMSRGEASIQKNRLNKVRITEYAPPHRFGFLANDPDAGDVSHVFTFKQENDGVLVERAMTLSLNPVLAFLFRLFIYPLVGSPSMEKALEKLKERLETPLRKGTTDNQV